ncbi:phosphotriesterase [Kitasatospora sp. MAP5-34]|uniref:phosphotriesterase family protein n=1 Tax=Kitasatospora sp. MAP5-34 TaxID=3035102 RepID=UPI0024750F73|nr:phosphotriesterase [Kitasatospora sp. MAP5-34]MDH6576931.1 putative metal-dependent phosphotriesterase family hydrolase [Kitasatospora sp. MAP5-34]
MTPATIRTVLGELPPGDFGVCDAHDHLFMSSPLLPGQELDDPAAAEAELRAFATLGGRAVVQWTPYGLGRRLPELVTLSRATGVHLVSATGLHQAAHYDPEQLRGLDLAELFITELVGESAIESAIESVDKGVDERSVRAGLIKVAGGYHGLDAHARRTMAAAAEAHHATGAPIAVHHELGTGALDVLDLLCGRLGVPARSVILGHLNRFPDLRLQRQAAEAGAYVALDGPSRGNHATDHHLFDTLAALAESGHADRLLLGGDTTTAAARGVPGMPHLLNSLRPRIIREFGTGLAESVFVTNPAHAFAAHWKRP